MWKKGFKPFRHVYITSAIDFWDNALVPSMEEEFRVLAYMPEEPRSENVYKLYIPNPDAAALEPIYLCKAENNGSVYIFSDIPVHLETYQYFEEIKMEDL